jgi:D-alanine-D-alanine ligase
VKIAILCNCREKYFLNKNDPIDRFCDMDSQKTINRIKDSFSLYYDVEVIEASPEALLKLYKSNYDFIFNFSEGVDGSNREMYFPAVLELLKIPFTGSDALTMGITFNKSFTKKVLSYHNISTPRFFTAENKIMINTNDAGFDFPWIVKPVHEGSSMGISRNNIIYNFKSAKKKIDEIIQLYKQPALVEEFICGREFSVGVLGNSVLEILPIIEIRKSDDSEEEFWVWDKSEASQNFFECPALPTKLEKKIKEIVVKSYRILRCQDWARIDCRSDKEGNIYVIEVNGISGLSEKSVLPFAAKKAGISFEELMNKILDYAIKRYASQKRSEKSLI